MDPTLVVLYTLVPLAFFTLLVLVLVLSARARRHRREGMAGFAQQREWRFYPDGAGFDRRFSGDPFGRGSRRTASNAVKGVYEGRTFVAFDYRYITSIGKDDTTHRWSVVSMHLGHLGHPVPVLEVAPQGTVGRFFTGLFGGDHLIGDPVFDDLFRIRTASPELAHDVLHPDMRTMLASQQDRAWRLEGDSLLMFRPGQHSPAEIDAVLASMKAILDRVPPSVWDRLRGGETPR